MDFLLFFMKKAVSTLFYPVGTSLVLLVAGLVAWLVRPRSRWGFFLTTTGTLWLLVTSLPITGFMLLRSLEMEAGRYADPADLSRRDVKFLVVLGGDVRGGDLTPADRVACSSLVRVMEGVRLWQGMSDAKLVLSGGISRGALPSAAEGMATLARDMGVPRSAMVLESESLDTADEARFLKPLLGKEAFAVVTSASHMKRSLMTFRMEGLDPIAAPADFECLGSTAHLSAFVPSAEGLYLSRKAFHEYLGSLALLLRHRHSP